MLTPPSRLDGAILAARYAYMPNKLRYCGGDANSELFAYIANESSDNGLKNLLKEFATMYPYLRLIAESNGILDPFDYRVVEAYWLGNELLNTVSMKNFYRYLIDEQKLKKKLNSKITEKVFGKIPLGVKPHHSWHVLNIPKRTGHYAVEHTLETMDQCRISWAQIKKIESSIGQMATTIKVETQPLVAEGNKIALGPAVKKNIWADGNNGLLTNSVREGDWLAVHWNWACDILSAKQVENLKKWTIYNLKIANI